MRGRAGARGGGAGGAWVGARWAWRGLALGGLAWTLGYLALVAWVRPWPGQGGGGLWSLPEARAGVVPPRETAPPPSAGAAPPRVPRILHQTFSSWAALRPRQLEAMETWRRLNPTWEMRYWTDRDCEEFVRSIFPELLPSFLGLSHAVERADYFRYLVVYSLGGFYADTDVDCIRPLDAWLPPTAAFVVGLENEFATPADASRRTYARVRQYEQFVFGGERGHPILRRAVERIRQEASPSGDSEGPANGGQTGGERGVLDRTGPGLWTDLIYEHVAREVAAERPLDSLLLLPRTAFGVFSNGADGIYMEDVPNGGLLGLHGFRGSWKRRRPWWRRALGGIIGRSGAQPAPASAPDPPGLKLMPVSVPFGSPGEGEGGLPEQWINVFARRMSHPQGYDGRDPGATLSAWGSWQGGFTPGGRPRVADVLRSCARAAAEEGREVSFLSVGAQGGLLSAALASQGVPTLSLTWDSEDCERNLLTRGASPALKPLVLKCFLGVEQGGEAVGGLGLPAQEVLRHMEGVGAHTNVLMRLGADALAEPAVLGAILSPNFPWRKVGSLALEISSSPSLPSVAAAVGAASPSELLAPLSALRERGFTHLFHAGRLCLNKWLEEPYVLREGHCTVDCVPCTYSEDPEACRSGRGAHRWLSHPSWCYVPADDAEAIDALVANALKLPPHRAEQLLLTRGAPPALASNLLLSGGFLPAQQPSEALDALHELQSSQ